MHLKASVWHRSRYAASLSSRCSEALRAIFPSPLRFSEKNILRISRLLTRSCSYSSQRNTFEAFWRGNGEESTTSRCYRFGAHRETGAQLPRRRKENELICQMFVVLFEAVLARRTPIDEPCADHAENNKKVQGVFSLIG